MAMNLFHFTCIFLSSVTGKTCAYMTVLTRRMLYKKHELLTFRQHLDSQPDFNRVRVVHVLNFLFCVFCFILYPMLPVSLD